MGEGDEGRGVGEGEEDMEWRCEEEVIIEDRSPCHTLFPSTCAPPMDLP